MPPQPRMTETRFQRDARMLKNRADRATEDPRWPGSVPLPGHVIEPIEAPDSVIQVPLYAGLAAGASAANQVQWPTNGVVIGVRVMTQADGSLAGMASLGLKVTLSRDSEEVITNGTSGDFVLFANLVGPGALAPFPLRRVVRFNDIWVCTVKNFHTATTFTPSIAFFFQHHPEC